MLPVHSRPRPFLPASLPPPPGIHLPAGTPPCLELAACPLAPCLPQTSPSLTSGRSHTGGKRPSAPLLAPCHGVLCPRRAAAGENPPSLFSWPWPRIRAGGGPDSWPSYAASLTLSPSCMHAPHMPPAAPHVPLRLSLPFPFRLSGASSPGAAGGCSPGARAACVPALPRRRAPEGASLDPARLVGFKCVL
jgi:hypothetical protein